MNLDYILDPRGEIILVVRNPNAPFAVWPSTTSEDGEPSTSSREGDFDKMLTNNDAFEETNTGAFTATIQKVFNHDLEEPQKDVRIQASARHLILGSPVFNRMLNGNWTESRQFKEKGSIELIVDSWDVEALLVVLNIAHSYLRKVPRRVTVEQLAKIAVIADYYDCQNVQFFSGLWLRAVPKEPPSQYSRDMVLCLWVSYFFQYKALFTTYSSAAMERATCHISSLGLPIPGTIISDMNIRRISSIHGVVGRVYIVRNMILHDSPTDSLFCCSECASMLLGSLLRYMSPLQMGLLEPTEPYFGVRFSEIVNIANFKPPACVSGMWDTRDSHESTRRLFLEMYSDFAKSIKGLNLAEYVIIT